MGQQPSAGFAEEHLGRISRNTLFNTFRAVLGAGLAFATGIIVARGLGPTDAGVYTLVIWVALAANIILSSGMASTLTKFVAQLDLRTDRAAVASVVAFGIRVQLTAATVGALVLVAASGLLASAFDIPDAQRLFVLSALIVLSYSSIDILTAPIIGLERQGLLVPLKTAWALVWLISAATALIVFDAGLEALIYVQVLVWIVTATLHYFVLTKVVSVRRAARLSKARRRQITRSALALGATGALGLVVFMRSEVFILGYFGTTAEVAFYSIAYAMAEALQQIVPVALAMAVMPNLSRAFAARDFAFAQRAYEGQLRLTAVVVLPVAVTGAVLSRQVINVFYGTDFEEAAAPLAVLLFTAGISSMGACALWVLVSSDKERVVFWLTAALATISLGLGLGLIPLLGLSGAVAAEASTQLALLVFSITAVWRIVGFGFPARGVARVVIANIPVLVSVLLVSATLDRDVAALLIGLIIAVPAYAVGLWAAKALTPFETRYLRRLLPTGVKS
jgi:O-antigen/teichoic acid export membrane protein